MQKQEKIQEENIAKNPITFKNEKGKPHDLSSPVPIQNSNSRGSAGALLSPSSAPITDCCLAAPWGGGSVWRDVPRLGGVQVTARPVTNSSVPGQGCAASRASTAQPLGDASPPAAAEPGSHAPSATPNTRSPLRSLHVTLVARSQDTDKNSSALPQKQWEMPL